MRWKINVEKTLDDTRSGNLVTEQMGDRLTYV